MEANQDALQNQTVILVDPDHPGLAYGTFDNDGIRNESSDEFNQAEGFQPIPHPPTFQDAIRIMDNIYEYIIPKTPKPQKSE